MRLIKNTTEKILKAKFKGREVLLPPGVSTLSEEEAVFVKSLWGFLKDVEAPGEMYDVIKVQDQSTTVVADIIPNYAGSVVVDATVEEELPSPSVPALNAELMKEPAVEAPKKTRKKKVI